MGDHTRIIVTGYYTRIRGEGGIPDLGRDGDYIRIILIGYYTRMRREA